MLVGLLGAADDVAGADWLTRPDLDLVGRILHFLDHPPVGDIRVAIVYADAVPGSRDEARMIASWMQGGLDVGDLVLHGEPIEQAGLGTATGFAAIITAGGISAASVRPAMQRMHVPCLTGHVDQVQAGDCMIAIRSTPGVSIKLKEAAAESTGVRFATAFRMMVDQL